MRLLFQMRLNYKNPNSPARIERRDIDQIIEEPNGQVILKFRPLSILDDPSIPGPSNYQRSFSDFSSRSEPLDHLQRYRFRALVPEPVKILHLPLCLA